MRDFSTICIVGQRIYTTDNQVRLGKGVAGLADSGALHKRPWGKSNSWDSRYEHGHGQRLELEVRSGKRQGKWKWKWKVAQQLDNKMKC